MESLLPNAGAVYSGEFKGGAGTCAPPLSLFAENLTSVNVKLLLTSCNLKKIT